MKGLKFNRFMFQMINGGPLPKFEIHTPSSSFDAQGRFNSAVELPGKSISKLFSYHDFFSHLEFYRLGSLAQLVVCLTVDPAVAS